MRVAINGFGRIGRLVLRRLATTSDIDVVAINDLADNDALSYLFRYDSVHGRVAGASVADDVLTFGDRRIPMFSERNPEDLKWGDKGVDVVIEATGAFRKRAAAKRHLDSGAQRVLITAPAIEPDRTIVLGVNEDSLNLETDRIISNASCTTNCIAPIASVLHETFGIESLALTTVHAYTSSQALVDVPMRKIRRGRAAAVSMIPTTTGASQAVAQVIPALQGRMTGMAVRVPVPDGSLTDMVVRLSDPPSDTAALNAALRAAAATDRLRTVIEVSDDPLVSIDIVGNDHSTVVDAESTAQVSADTFKLFSWYDNEWGYSCRVVDLARRLCGKPPVGL